MKLIICLIIITFLAMTTACQNKVKISQAPATSSGGSTSGGSGGGSGQTLTPLVTVTTPADNNRKITLANASSFTVAGTCKYNGGSVVISDGATINVTITCPISEAINQSIDFSAVADSTITLTVTQTNDLSATSQVSRTIVKIADFCNTNSNPAAFASGNGSVGTPYLVCNASQFNLIKAEVNGFSGKYFKLMNDINFAGATVPTISQGAWQPAFDNNIFEGNYLTLSNFVVNGPSLFGNLSSNGQIKNLYIDSATIVTEDGKSSVLTEVMSNSSVVDNVHITNSVVRKAATMSGSKNGFGAIAGETTDNATISNSSASITIDGLETSVTVHRFSKVGGIVGANFSATTTLTNLTASGVLKGDAVGGIVGESINGIVISNSTSTATITCDSHWCGGIVGRADSGTPSSMTNNHYNGSITGIALGGHLGGIVGRANNLTMTQCSAKGTLAATLGGDSIGGLVGDLGGTTSTIQRSYSTMTINVSVTGQGAGGVIGWVSGTTVNITDVYSTGNVTTSSQAGGLVGGHTGTTINFTNAFTLGKVTGSAASEEYPYAYVSGTGNCVQNCFFDKDLNTSTNISGSNFLTGGMDKTNAELRDFANLGTMNVQPNWKLDTTVSPYPILTWQ